MPVERIAHVEPLDRGLASFANPSEIDAAQLSFSENVQNFQKGKGVSRRAGYAVYRDLNQRLDIFGPAPILVQLETKWISRIGERFITCANGVLADVTDPTPANWMMIRNDMEPSSKMESCQFQDKRVIANGRRTPIQLEYVPAPYGKIYYFSSQPSPLRLIQRDATQYGLRLSVSQAIGVSSHMAVDGFGVYARDNTTGKEIHLYDHQSLQHLRTVFGSTAILGGVDTYNDGGDLYVIRASNILQIRKRDGAVLNTSPVLTGPRDIHVDSTNVYVIEATNVVTKLTLVLGVVASSAVVPSIPVAITGDSAFIYTVGSGGVSKISKTTLAIDPSSVPIGSVTDSITFNGRKVLVGRTDDKIAELDLATAWPITPLIVSLGTANGTVQGLTTPSIVRTPGAVSRDVTSLLQPVISAISTGGTIGSGTFDAIVTWTDQANRESGASTPAVPIITTGVTNQLVVEISQVLIPNLVTQPTSLYNPVFKLRSVYIRESGKIVHSITIGPTGTGADIIEASPNIQTSVIITALNGRSSEPRTISDMVGAHALVTTNDSRVYFGADPASPGFVQACEPGFLDYIPPESFATISATVDRDSQITDIVASDERTFVTARDIIGFLQFTGVRTFEIRIITRTRGSRGPSVIEWAGQIRMLGDDGLYEGLAPDGKIGWPFEDFWRGLNGFPGVDTTKLREAVAAYEPRSDQSWWAVREVGASGNNVVIIWDSYKRAPYIFRHAGILINSLATIEDDVRDERRIFAGTTDGRILLMNEGNADATTPITWKARTKLFMSPGENAKMLGEIHIHAQGYFPGATTAPKADVRVYYAERGFAQDVDQKEVVQRDGRTVEIDSRISKNSPILRPIQMKRIDVEGGEGEVVGFMIEAQSKTPLVTDEPFAIQAIGIGAEGKTDV